MEGYFGSFAELDPDMVKGCGLVICLVADPEVGPLKMDVNCECYRALANSTSSF